MDLQKPIHNLVLDAGPILKNEPTVSRLLGKAQELITVPSVISEIRDVQARERIQTTLLPFLTQKNPQNESVKLVSEFARKTGDLEVLSRADIQILALAYELECERNHGDWRLRSTPGQKRVNGAPPAELRAEKPHLVDEAESESNLEHAGHNEDNVGDQAAGDHASEEVDLANLKIDGGEKEQSRNTITKSQEDPTGNEAKEDSGSDSEGWITHTNIKKHQMKDANADASPGPAQKMMQVATITTDFAMQNVLLQMNLNLLSPSLQRVRHLKTHVLRCHACFQKTKDMSKQFCPRCGKPALTRVTCSTTEKGEFKLHLKKNMQWNTRGDKYSIPKPTGGTSSGKTSNSKGGGFGGWGHGLILAEDQKEYVRAMQTEKRRREKDLMDQDMLPAILSGARDRPGGRPKVGAGRNVNARKRK